MGGCASINVETKVRETVTLGVVHGEGIKRLRRQPTPASECFDGPEVTKGTVVEVLKCVCCPSNVHLLTEKPGRRTKSIPQQPQQQQQQLAALERGYVQVRVQGEIGYIRDKHLRPVANEQQVRAERRKSLIVLWASLKKGLGLQSAVTIAASLAPEMYPWWLLQDRPQLSDSLSYYYSRMLYEAPKPRTFKVHLSKSPEGRIGICHWGPNIISVARGSSAARAGLRPGQRIVSVNGMGVSTQREIHQAVLASGRKMLLVIANPVIGRRYRPDLQCFCPCGLDEHIDPPNPPRHSLPCETASTPSSYSQFSTPCDGEDRADTASSLDSASKSSTPMPSATATPENGVLESHDVDAAQLPPTVSSTTPPHVGMESRVVGDLHKARKLAQDLNGTEGRNPLFSKVRWRIPSKCTSLVTTPVEVDLQPAD